MGDHSAINHTGITGVGALVFLAAQTASASAQLDFTTFISSTYDDYLIEGVDIAPATNAVNLQLRIGTGGGPTYDTANNYEWGGHGIRSDGTAQADNGSTGIMVVLPSLSNNAAYGFGCFSIRAMNLQSTAHRKSFFGTAQFVNSAPANAFVSWGGQWITSGTAVTALRFMMSSGNIASGTIRIYGITKS